MNFLPKQWSFEAKHYYIICIHNGKRKSKKIKNYSHAFQEMQTSQNTTQILTCIFDIHNYEAKKKQNQTFPLLPFDSVHQETDFITFLVENGIFKMIKYNVAQKFANPHTAT